MLHSVAHVESGLQHIVAHGYAPCAIFRCMGNEPVWKGWRQRAKNWKRDNKLSDAYIAEEIGVKRATVNSWFNKREPNLSDFMNMCAVMGADPGHILFERPILRTLVPPNSLARKVASASPTAEPGHKDLMKKFERKSREFKKKRVRLRRKVSV